MDLAILTVRNEGAFLLEWLAHHRAVGFDRFLVLSNDCQDGTDQMLDRLEALGWLTHLPNPAPHEGGVQFAAMNLAAKHPLAKQADWIMALDIDEFVNIHAGDGTLNDLRALAPKATAFPITWRLFGNDGVVRFDDRPVTAQFRHAAPAVMTWPWRAAMFKTLYRADGTYKKPGVHRPRSPDRDRLADQVWVDGAGRRLPEQFAEKGLFSPFGRDNYPLAQINHYALGAMESFILKADRGRAVHADDKLGMDYWCDRNWCCEEDTSIDRYIPARNAHLDVLRDDATLSALHNQAVQWRKDRFDALMLDETNRALMGRMLMTPPNRTMGDDHARWLYDYARRANS